MSLFVIVIISCRKNVVSPSNDISRNIRVSLQDSLSPIDYKSLDFSRVVRTVIKERLFIRVAFKEKSMSELFVLIDVQSNGKINKGRVVQLRREGAAENFNGELVIKSLKGEVIEVTTLVNGYRRRGKVMNRSLVIEPDPYVVLPEVIVVASPRSGGTSWNNWYNLDLFFEGVDHSGSWTGTYAV